MGLIFSDCICSNLVPVKTVAWKDMYSMHVVSYALEALTLLRVQYDAILFIITIGFMALLLW